MSKTYSIVIPTNRSLVDIQPLLECIGRQTLPPQTLIIVYDKDENTQKIQRYIQDVKQTLQKMQKKIETKVFSTIGNDDFEPHKGASYLRNFGIKHVKTPFVCCVDDDNTFGPTFFSELMDHACRRESEDQQQCIFMPTEIYRDTKMIRSQGYGGINVWTGAMQKSKPKNEKILSGKKNQKETVPLVLCSSNCLFGHTTVFRDIPFDERVPFVAEDFLMTAQVSSSEKYGLYCATNVYIHHYMRDKTKKEDVYVHTPFHAYQKGKNRILVVQTLYAGGKRNVYFCLGLWIHTLYLSVVLLLSRGIAWKTCLSSLRKGTMVGLRIRKQYTQ